MPREPKIRNLHIFAISPKKHGGEVGFLPVDKHKILVSSWVCVATHAGSTQNKKFAIYWQHLEENMKIEVDFLSAD